MSQSRNNMRHCLNWNKGGDSKPTHTNAVKGDTISRSGGEDGILTVSQGEHSTKVGNMLGVNWEGGP